MQNSKMNYYKALREVISEDLEKFNYPNKKLGVIAHIVDSEGKILLQQRGAKSRDENGLYEDVGGKVDNTDLSYRQAMIRELEEEMGTETIIELGDSIGIYHCNKNDINWVFVVFYGLYKGGRIKIMEPDKCLGYKFFDYEETIDSNNVSESCKYLTKVIKKNHNF